MFDSLKERHKHILIRNFVSLPIPKQRLTIHIPSLMMQIRIIVMLGTVKPSSIEQESTEVLGKIKHYLWRENQANK